MSIVPALPEKEGILMNSFLDTLSHTGVLFVECPFCDWSGTSDQLDFIDENCYVCRDPRCPHCGHRVREISVDIPDDF
jgi:diadenosine tetraphosphatase ApaH/serine/threonine PP2A family protein phosphatase